MNNFILETDVEELKEKIDEQTKVVALLVADGKLSILDLIQLAIQNATILGVLVKDGEIETKDGVKVFSKSNKKLWEEKWKNGQ